MSKRPPQHRITPALRIVDMGDPAWDKDRYEAEIEDLEGEELADHPIMAYRLGKTHFDLDAIGHADDAPVCPADYLTGTPRFFEARRLTVGELAACLDRGIHGGQMLAFHLAVKRVDGFEFQVRPKKVLSDNQVQAVADEIGAEVVMRIGRSIIDSSRAPIVSEGKRSGSSPGNTSPSPGVSPADGSPGTATDV